MVALSHLSKLTQMVATNYVTGFGSIERAIGCCKLIIISVKFESINLFMYLFIYLFLFEFFLGEKKGFIFIVISSGNNVDIIHH
jgi:hypothetical protein